MQVQKFNFVLNQGEDFKMLLTVKDKDNDLIDLTGYSFTGQARLSHSSLALSFSFTFDIKNQVARTGEVSMEINDTASSAITVGDLPQNFVYDVEMEDPDEKRTRLFEGIVTVTPEVTR